MPTSPERIAHLAAEAGLREHGYAVVQDLFAPVLVARLADTARAAAAGGALRPAAVGSGAGSRLLPSLRGDAIAWLERSAPAAAADGFLDACERLRRHLNRNLLLGLASMEAHFALYPPGASYGRHRDRFLDDDSRVVSLVCYLDRAWGCDDGGELRLYTGDGHVDVIPQAGTSVLFLSGTFEHEVLPARRARHSIACWFRQRSIGNAL
jgi:SM-20-related protein